MASIPIPGGHSLHPVKKVGGVLLRLYIFHWAIYTLNKTSPWRRKEDQGGGVLVSKIGGNLSPGVSTPDFDSSHWATSISDLDFRRA